MRISKIPHATALMTALAALVLSGCQSDRGSTASTEPSISAAQTMARGAEQRGDWAAAARSWETEVIAAPNDRAAALALVHALRLSNACGRAVPYLEKLRTAAPQDLEVLLETAKCDFTSGRFEAARTVLDTAVRAHPDSWEAETVLAAVLDHMERSQEALAHHDRAVQLAPQNPLALGNKAMSLALGGDLPAALELMRKAAAQPGAPSRVRMNLALLEAVAGNGDMAVMTARQEVRGDPESIRLLQRISAAAHEK